MEFADQPLVDQLFGQNGERTAGCGLGVCNGLFNELGVVGHAGHENTLFHEVHRTHFKVRFHKEAFTGERDTQDLGQLSGPL